MTLPWCSGVVIDGGVTVNADCHLLLYYLRVTPKRMVGTVL